MEMEEKSREPVSYNTELGRIPLALLDFEIYLHSQLNYEWKKLMK